MAHLNIPEDAASLLEQFVHDVANTPAEVTHLLEEIQAKDQQILLYKDEIAKRDAQLQKWVRLNGGHVLNPKEDAFSRTIVECFDKCEILQAEKCGLSEKALIVLERQLKRLDTGLRGLMTREEFPSDWNGPTLIGSGATSGIATPAANVVTGPLQAVSSNIGSTGGMANIANAAQHRMAARAAGMTRLATDGAQSPVSAPRAQRDSSSDASKRRRLNASLGPLPTASSSLRQSSIGPGTPKAGTPNPVSSRAGSAQPVRPSAVQKKAPTNATSRKLAPPQPSKSKRPRPSQLKKQRDRRHLLVRSGRSATPSSAASGSAASSRSTSPSPSTQARSQNDGNGSADANGSADDDDDDDAGEDPEDTTLYCFCQKVSFGNMVGCDNDNCKYQWFHWDCVDLKHEPKGEWLCPECRKLPRDQIAISK